MDATAQVETIVYALRKFGVSVRYEHLGGEGGGICHIRGETVLFIDSDADIGTTAERCLEAVAAIPEIRQALPAEIRSKLGQDG